MIRHASARPLDDLLCGTARGDADAFARLFEAAGSRVHGVAARVLRDQHQAEEVTQEVFLHVWRSAADFDPARGSAQAWLVTLAHGRAVDRVRSSERSRRREAAEATVAPGTPYDETASTVDAALDAEQVRSALASLPTCQRRALELAYFGGHTHAEVSRLLQVPLGTAKGRIRDGLRRLRDVLGVEVAEPVRAGLSRSEPA